jgi:hypothetical protein
VQLFQDLGITSQKLLLGTNLAAQYIRCQVEELTIGPKLEKTLQMPDFTILKILIAQQSPPAQSLV